MKNETFEVVRVHDPALAGCELEDVKRYAESREMRDLPKLPPGAPGPVVFHCRRLTRSEMLDYVDVITGEERRWARAFGAGVVRVTGGRFEGGWEPRGASAKPRAAMTDDEMEHAQFSTADLREIGHVIYTRSDCPFDCAPRYRLLPSSLDVWGGNARRYVAPSPASAPLSSEPPKGE